MTEELRPVPRSGHVSAVVGNFMLVWGGYTELNHDGYFIAERYLAPSEVWVYGRETEKWLKLLTRGTPPTGTSGAVALYQNNHLYIIGGHTSEGNTSEVYSLDVTTRQWRHLAVEKRSQQPSPRDKFVGWQYNEKLYIFSGFGIPTTDFFQDHGDFVLDTSPQHPSQQMRGWNNQLFIFDPETHKWCNPECRGSIPSPRAASGATILGDKVYLFGGRHSDERLNDLYILHIDSLTWERIHVKGTEPCARSWHSFTAASTKHILLYGGYTQDRKPLSDVWILDTEALQWSQLSVPMDRPRLWHTACRTCDDDILIFGGCSSDILGAPNNATEHKNDVIILRCSPPSLVRICLNAAYDFREVLQREWSHLPRHLYSALQSRTREHFADAIQSPEQQGKTCVVS